MYFLLLGILSYCDFKMKSTDYKELCTNCAMYFPFMVAIPQLSYHYEFVCILAVLPAISWLLKNTDLPVENKLLIFITLGLALSQFQAIAVRRLVGVNHPYFLPGFGLFMVMVGVTVYKLFRYRLRTQQNA